MTFKEFLVAIETKSPPNSPILQILYLDKIGDWHGAHDLADNLGGKKADRIHAYLHRREGDVWNTKYWYNRIGEPFPKISLDEEWDLLAKAYCD